MQRINYLFVHRILRHLIGGADVDDLPSAFTFASGDGDYESKLRAVLRSEVTPLFHASDAAAKEQVRHSLAYLIKVDPQKAEELFYSGLFPFGAPTPVVRL